MRVLQLLLLVLTLPLLAAAQSLPVTYTPIAANTPLEMALLNATNNARQQAGAPGLKQDDALALAARHHALEMATLEYVSHTSPKPEHASLLQRVALAGSPFVSVAENIARLPLGMNAEFAAVTVQGWLDSPGHRENLLNPAFTHVGFGTAQNDTDLYVVQVFSYQPFTLLNTDVSVRDEQLLTVNVRYSLASPQEVAFAYGQQQSRPVQQVAGEHETTFMLPGSHVTANKLHVLSAIKAPAGDGFITQSGGWVDVTTSTFTPDPATHKTELELLDVRVSSSVREVAQVEVGFSGSLGFDVAVLVDGAFQPDAVRAPGQLVFDVPGVTGGTVIDVGDVSAENQLHVIMQFELVTHLGLLRLAPVLSR